MSKQHLRHEDTYETHPIFKAYMVIIKERSRKERKKIYYKLGPKKLRRVKAVIDYRRGLLIQSKQVKAWLGILIKEIDKFFTSMQKKRKNK